MPTTDTEKIALLEEKLKSNYEYTQLLTKKVEDQCDRISKIKKQLYGNGNMEGSILFILNNMSHDQLATSELVSNLIERFDSMEKLILGGLGVDEVGLRNDLINLKKAHDGCTKVKEVEELSEKSIATSERMSKIETTVSNIKYFVGIGIPFIIVGVEILLRVVIK